MKQNKTASKSTIDVTSLHSELRQFFLNDDELLKEWLDTPLPVLNGEKPLSLMESKSGQAIVRQLLNEMKYGDFA